MSYQVLARQWRPKYFAEVTGQDYIVKALTNALKNGRLHHAYLFTGTRGTGKTTLARILAKSLNCERNYKQDGGQNNKSSRESAEPCGQCTPCNNIDQGNFIDLIEVDAASKTKVEDTRDLLERVQYMPSQGRYKVYLIDEVHMLSTHSFNSLLKTLEEPPEHVKFLLATTDPQKIPATVISRCLQFNLKPVAEKTIARYLEQILTRESIGFEQSALLTIARQATGSIRDALSLTDQAIAFTDGHISQEQINTMLGVVNNQAIVDLVRHLIAKDAKAVLNHITAISEQTIDLLSIVNQLLELLQQIAIIQQVAEAEICRDSIYNYQTLQELGTELSPEDCQLFYQIGLMGKKDWHIASNSKSHFEMMMLRMLAFKPYKGHRQAEPSRQPSAISTPHITSHSQAAGTTTEKPVQPAPMSQNVHQNTNQNHTAVPYQPKTDTDKEASPTEITQENWQNAITSIKVSAFAASLIKHAQWVKQTEPTIYLQLSEGYYALWETNYQREIEQALSKHINKPVKLEISCSSENTEQIQQSNQRSSLSDNMSVTPETNQLVADKAAHKPANKSEDKNLELLLNSFDAEVVTD